MSSSAGRFQLLIAAVLFSTGGAAIKATELTSWQVASFRSGIAALAVALLVPAALKGWTRKTLAVSVIYAGTMVLFVLANKLTTSANAIFLQSAAPLYILLAAPFLLKERVTRTDVMVMVAVAAGLGLVFTGRVESSATAPNPMLGNVLAILCGVFWACTVMGLRWLSSGDEAATAPLATVVLGNLVACVICLPMAFPVEHVRTVDFGLIMYLGTIQIGLAYFCVVRGLRAVAAFEASLILLAEPALNPVWSWLVHGEEPGVRVILGGLLILLATAARAWLGTRPGRAAYVRVEPMPD
ncbi:MAG TPA: DMT family transporter [Gemmatimonadales bacterium]|nr:DMT family transporter [Gemmatimonadales bacterium]